jgi:putative endonuclease
MHTTYVLYSKALKKYYVGSTSLALISRLRRHRSDHKGFTGRSNDWEIVFSQAFSEISSARKLEKKIKKRGAARFIKAQSNE